MVARATGHPKLRQLLARVVRETGYGKPGAERGDKILAAAIQKWIQQNIRYVREHPETYVSPWRTAKWRMGDCDDQVILAASLLRSAKIPARAMFAFWRVQNPDTKLWERRGHVWTEASVDGAWVPMETVRSLPFGLSPLQWLRQRGKQPVWLGIGDALDHIIDDEAAA